MIRRSSVLLLGLAALMLGAPPAKADAIDGDWCLPERGRMTIDGHRIITPGGKRTEGDYTRHSFKYEVPPGEAGTGTMILMVLLSEYAVQVRSSAGGPDQIWRRCATPVG